MPQPPHFTSAFGGVYPIASVVDDFIDRIMVDPRLNANPGSMKRTIVCPRRDSNIWYGNGLLGHRGPQKYTGRSMYESHKDMKITGPEWDAFIDDFQQTLDKFSVPAQEQAELRQSSTAHAPTSS